MLKLMGKKIFTILWENVCLSKPVTVNHVFFNDIRNSERLSYYVVVQIELTIC